LDIWQVTRERLGSCWVEEIAGGGKAEGGQGGLRLVPRTSISNFSEPFRLEVAFLNARLACRGAAAVPLAMPNLPQEVVDLAGWTKRF